MSAIPPVPPEFADRSEAWVAGCYDALDGEHYVGDGPYQDARHNDAFVAGWNATVQQMIGAE